MREETRATVITMKGVPFEQRDIVRIGFAGPGPRGRSLLHKLLRIEGASVVGIADPDPAALEAACACFVEAGKPAPVVCSGAGGYQELLRRDDIDLVYIASPWDLHAPMAVQAMEHGKHVAVEVPAATTLEECWQLVDTSERTRRHCVLLENCCYGYEEMLVNNLVHAGLLGTITHGEAAYIHDLRRGMVAGTAGGDWRRLFHTRKDGNLYSTHGLGPVAWYMDVHRGDRFTLLVSMSSREASMTEYRDRTLAADDPKRRERYICGDMNTSLIRTAQGRTIMLQHDVVTPRPYDRNNLIAGTRGTFRDYPARLYLDGQEGHHEWGTLEPYKEQYEHTLWKQMGERARHLGGHGGMDYLLNWRLIECFHQGLPPDIDVYDSAAWSAPGPLSELSVAQGSMPIPFPDFTRGHWQK